MTDRAMKRPILLIVDDNAIVRMVLRASFESAGFRVETLSSAFQLNAAISEHQPDAILLDVYMPALRGDRAAEILSQRRFAKQIPIILLSDSDEDELAKLAVSAGAAGYVKKSPDHQQVVAKVRSYLSASTRRVGETESRFPRP